MRILLVGVLLVSTSGILTAQTRAQPNLILSIYGGTSAGYSLWTRPRQLMRGDGRLPQPDTVRLVRNVNSSLTAGMIATLYTSPNLGFSVEAAFRTFSFDDTCSPAAPFQADSDTTGYRNDRACANITASGASGSVLSLAFGPVLRLASRGSFSPFLRGELTYSYTALSTIAMAEPGDAFGNVTPLLIGDDSPGQGSIGVLGAAGFTLALGPGYQFRLEVRDHLSALRVVDGNADAVGVAPTRNRMVHNLGLIMGLDVVLEQRRGRRY